MINSAPKHLVTDDFICGIELPRHLAPAVTEFLCANGLDALIIEIANGRQIHVAQGHRRAARAIEALRNAGAVIYADGDHIPVPDLGMHGDELPSIPPVVVIAAALRSVSSDPKPCGNKISSRRRRATAAA